MSLPSVAWAFAGLIAGVCFLLFARSRSTKERLILRLGLLVAAAIYIGLAMVAGEIGGVLLAAMGALIYGGFVWLSVRYSDFWLGTGWLLHPLWDWLYLSDAAHHNASHWYAIACLPFDLLVAGYILTRSTQWAKQSSQ